jgi:hypothetical protein
MKLFSLMYGKSKNKMRCIMTDKLSKCENYKTQREKSKGSKCSMGWHEIVPAEAGAEIWRQKSATIGGNRCEMVQRVGHGLAGYIDRHGFNPHT